jgi:serine phosphatase RsbU (regulator of sigma subunit)
MHEGFATCLVVRVEDQGRLTLANAGHLPPYKNGIEIELPGTLPLGLVKTAAYEQMSLEMAVGDAIVLLTDGIAEAQNEQRQLLGFARVESLLREGATAQAIAEIAQNHGQNDDVTIIRVGREA